MTNSRPDPGIGERYRRTLLEDVVPFWMKHSPDREMGGYFNSLDRDGSVLDTDKYLWPQNREVWMFSTLCNEVEKRSEWLDMARLGVEFLKAHGRDPDGDWYFALTRDGRPLIQPYNIYTDYFAVTAFAEYFRATGEGECLEIALQTFRRMQQRWSNPKGRFNKLVPASRPLKTLGFPMVRIHMCGVLQQVHRDPVYDDVMDECIREVMTQFVNRKARVIQENVGLDGSVVDSYEGRHVNPGHGIESMWFILEIAERRNDRDLIEQACRAVKWNLEFSWDREYGGIFYFMDRDGRPHASWEWDMKLWWPHLEALVACMMGYRLTGDPELLEWFERIDEYAWSRFPDREHGEWFGYLSREGRVTNFCKANRWKASLHLPRALLRVWKETDAILAEGKS